MLDKWALKCLSKPSQWSARQLAKTPLSANQVTLFGFGCGLGAAILVAFNQYQGALALLLINRLCDGLDGALARVKGSTSAGAYLDICCDFIFYSAMVVGFAFSAPEQNALISCVLILSFMTTGSTFLAFAILAEKHQLTKLHYPNKGFYYLGGITEGTETIAFLVLCCLFPDAFYLLAAIFASLCFITGLIRLYSGYLTLKPLANIGD
ncbi:CDP-alcohol phosphatidyltransferase family protein [Motilimonas eburnea]|uniref:CDP-alcohol phosphatidyltransferase family protein n=1 Tax=Motilimonas eburnea TaxID=1737488 RepID=UPI001E404207|nr:CDP-alcohol phosphatidyltransferase family protein [Motilimonas eburnea]MCE2570310.1 CDP-alcohol phosphatidyltransferase family protein [Motilimonas eburnea]